MAQAHTYRFARDGAAMTPDLFAEAVVRSRQANRDARKQPAQPKRQKATKPLRTVPLEKDEQAQLFRWASYAVVTHPELVTLHAIPNAGGYVGGFQNNMQRVLAMKREGMRAGVPDVHLPHARGKYHSFYIELKRIGATASATSDRQRDWHERLRAAGNAVAVCRGWEAARDALLAYLALDTTTNRG